MKPTGIGREAEGNWCRLYLECDQFYGYWNKAKNRLEFACHGIWGVNCICKSDGEK
jgi:hypothetical protein